MSTQRQIRLLVLRSFRSGLTSADFSRRSEREGLYHALRSFARNGFSGLDSARESYFSEDFNGVCAVDSPDGSRALSSFDWVASELRSFVG